MNNDVAKLSDYPALKKLASAYLLVPHDQIVESKCLIDFQRFEVLA
jgi:hypothetical protein